MACLRFVRKKKEMEDFDRTFPGLKLAAAIGAARTVKVIRQRPPSRRKKEPGLSSAHE
jgi:hypothetical protein